MTFLRLARRSLYMVILTLGLACLTVIVTHETLDATWLKGYHVTVGFIDSRLVSASHVLGPEDSVPRRFTLTSTTRHSNDYGETSHITSTSSPVVTPLTVNCLPVSPSNATLRASVECKRVNLTGQYAYSFDRVTEVYAICQWERSTAPLVTLFTTMYHSDRLIHIHNNTLHLWAELGEQVRNVLFIASTRKEAVLAEVACAYKWDVYVVPYCGLSQQLPLLKAMYLAAQVTSCQHPSPFYGYANSDILFDESLLKTLKFLEPHYDVMAPVLMVGRRTLLMVHDEITSLSTLRLRVAATNGSSSSVAGVDYFITSRNYPWEKAPNIVIGRVAYDNWIIRNAKSHHRMTIELTNSTLSVHQSADTKYYRSHRVANSGINNKVIGGFDFTQGLISCAAFKTVSMDGGLHLMRRIKYGMCGNGHWGRRKTHPFGINELTVEVDPDNLTWFIGEPFRPVPGT